jgi:hypothetical protein
MVADVGLAGLAEEVDVGLLNVGSHCLEAAADVGLVEWEAEKEDL